MVKNSNSPIGKCDKCSKELKRNSFYVIRKEEEIKQKFCPDCYREHILSHHHNFWTCYKCYKSGDLSKEKYPSTCPECHYEDIWLSEVDEAGGEKVISCDNSGNFPSRPIKQGRTILLIMVIVSVAFCGLVSWMLEEKNKAKKSKEKLAKNIFVYN